jgi:hypothetical protein
MKPRPIFDVDREAQIVALWQGRPHEQRRTADVDPFCQWLVDYAPWLVPGRSDFRREIRVLIAPHTVECDDADRLERPPHRRRQRQSSNRS